MTTVLPGYNFLRRPTPAPPPKGSPNQHIDTPGSEDKPAAECTDEQFPAPSRIQAAMMVTLWLEVVVGLRQISVLEKGAFHRRVINHASLLSRTIKAGAPARVKSMHIQRPLSSIGSHRREVRYCATILLGGRVRAVAGTFRLEKVQERVPLDEFRLKRKSQGSRWLLETLRLI